MFCFQCEQTKAGTGCVTDKGVCGKQASTAHLQDQLTGALMTLATVAQDHPWNAQTRRLVIEALFTTLTNVDFDDNSVSRQIERVHRAVHQLNPKLHEIVDADMNLIWDADEDTRSLKTLILLGIRGMAAYLYHALVLGYPNDDAVDFIGSALATIARHDVSGDELLPLVLKTGEVNLSVMETLDKANTTAFGTPEPTPVSFTIEPGPFIVVSGHDLHDLKLLLEQTEGKGVNIYTHGEMLPALAYPGLKKYAHLKGHFGTAWQNQQDELVGLPAPILFTTNCLMPPEDSYAANVFTTAAVHHPDTTYIDYKKDFTPVIERALALKGYETPHLVRGLNGGDRTMTGFAHGAVMSVAGKVVELVKTGKVKHIFLVGGCDGAKMGRNYFTEFVKAAPENTLILTLACGKFRFNDLDLGDIDGIPRLLDMGQCNDAYSAIQVAVALAQVFECDVNDLPLTLVLSWYEQKAVSILLTLLHLGIRNIRLGPTLPIFVSPHILNYLVRHFNIAPTAEVETDMAAMLGN
jgi:hydroxylamine reductase